MKRILLLSLMCASCSGEALNNERDQTSNNNEPTDEPITDDNDTGFDAQPDDDTYLPDSSDATEPVNPVPLGFATIGTRCVNGEKIEYAVLSDMQSTCEADAGSIDRYNQGRRIHGTTVVQLNGESQTVNYCERVGLDVVFGYTCFSFQPEIDVENGVWTATIDGHPHRASFTSTMCDYDLVVPQNPEVLAFNISVTEVSVYQGVKIPIVEQGAPISTARNSPIVADRPGVIRVFVEPESGWEPREIVARLTINDLIKEVRFSPTGASLEADYTSTINFELLENELASNAEYSVELLEADGPVKTAALECTGDVGDVARARIPRTGTLPLDSESLNAAMKIVIIPIQYDGDGSGRIPLTDASMIQRFKDAAFAHFPVPGIEISVDPTIVYDGVLNRRQSGWMNLLNFCVAKRAADNPPPETFYYCVVQPSETFEEYCGLGCLAGLGPVPLPFEVELRASVGLSFNGDGENIFIHELGHTLGRLHSPCGNPGNTEPTYPHAGGQIGSRGYNVLSGEFIETDATDFMGYCDNTWVSDYTYGMLFSRLKSVTNTAPRIVGNPTRWRTAFLDMDGSMNWGRDLTLNSPPSGATVPAALFDVSGAWVKSVEVYATRVGDLDGLFLTVEDTGLSGKIVVDDVGELTIP